MTRPSHRCRLLALTGALGLALTPALGALVLVPATTASAAEAPASQEDSQAQRWAGTTKDSPYTMQIRLSDRVELTGGSGFATSTPALGCDVAGDAAPDVISADPQQGRVDIVTYVPAGSTSDQLTRSVEEQEGHVSLAGPASATGFGSAVACTPGSLLVLDATGTLHRYAGPVTEGAAPTASYTLGSEPIISVTALATPSRASSLVAVATASQVAVIDAALLPAGGAASTDLSLVEGVVVHEHALGSALTLHAVGDTDGDSVPDLAVAQPQAGRVTLATHLTSPGALASSSLTLSAGSGAFGTAVASLGDLDDDGRDDLAVGAPQAGGGQGAVAVVMGRVSGDVTVNLDAAGNNALPVTDPDGQRAGYLHRTQEQYGIGSTLAHVHADGTSDALVIGLPHNGEDSGAVIVPSYLLTTDHVSGQGLHSLPSSQLAPMSNGNDGDGTMLSVLPPREGDRLVPVLIGRGGGALGVWTTDVTAGDGPARTDGDLPPQPVQQVPDPALVPTDTADLKTWLGEFSQGLGSTLARGSCDVTGDGVSDIVASALTRSEWKYDPYYAETTPTKGWVHNVTGQVQVIPGGTPGSALPAQGVIEVNGPRSSGETEIDASIGLAITCLSDANGDGVGDIAVSSHTMGRVWVIYGGPDLALTDLNNLAPERGYMISLPALGNPAGHLADAGDLNGDGLSDLTVVTYNTAFNDGADTPRGVAYVVAGNATGASVDLTATYADGPAVLARVIPPVGNLATSLDAVGDVNGDGRTDFLLADYTANEAPNVVSGTAWLLTDVSNGSRIEADAQGRMPGSRLTVPADASYRLGIGTSVAPAGDVDGDGMDDFVIGFDGGNMRSTTEGGVALIHGAASMPATLRIDPKGLPDPLVSVVTAPSPGSWAGYAVDVLVREGEPTMVALGAPGTSNSDGVAYLMPVTVFAPKGGSGSAGGSGSGSTALRTAALSERVRSVEELGDSVRAIVSAADPGSSARFGKGVAFVGNLLGQPTLALSGDGVIDDDANDVQGYSHAAHVMAIGLGLPPKDDGGDNGTGPGTGTAPGSDAGTLAGNQPGQPGALARTGSSLTALSLALVVVVGGALLLARRRRGLAEVAQD